MNISYRHVTEKDTAAVRSWKARDSHQKQPVQQ